MEFDFDTPIDRCGTSSLKWARFEGRDVIPMWVADMDFPAPPAVLDAIRGHLDHGVLGYTVPGDELAATVVDALARDHGWEVDPAWLVWLPGVVPGLNIACRMIRDPGRRVLVTTPVYPPFMSAPGNWGHHMADVPLAPRDGRLTFDLEAFRERARGGADLFLLCNPENPAGIAHTRAELEAVAEFCLSRGILVCSDEIHCGLILDPGVEHIPFASLSNDVARNCIVLMAPSKTYNIPGLCCSFAVIPNRDLKGRFLRAMRGIVPEVNALGYTACNAAYRDGRQWRGDLLDYLAANRDLVEQAVARMPGLTMRHVEATYLAWIDCREAGMTDPTAFFERAGVGLSDGGAFGTRGFVRLNFACPGSLLRKGLERMRHALETPEGRRSRE